MDHRSGRRRKFGVSAREERWALFLIISVVCVPLLGTVAVLVSTNEPDLSDLMPIVRNSGDYLLLDWPGLRQAHPHAMVSGSRWATFNGAAVQALGYMADGERPIAKGSQVKDFVLLPDGGNLLHPAHRFGDQMVSVHLREGDAIPFSPRRLVWVWGTFRALAGDPAGPKPLYALEQSHSQPADKADIHRFLGLP